MIKSTEKTLAINDLINIVIKKMLWFLLIYIQLPNTIINLNSISN